MYMFPDFIVDKDGHKFCATSLWEGWCLAPLQLNLATSYKSGFPRVLLQGPITG